MPPELTYAPRNKSGQTWAEAEAVYLEESKFDLKTWEDMPLEWRQRMATFKAHMTWGHIDGTPPKFVISGPLDVWSKA